MTTSETPRGGDGADAAAVAEEERGAPTVIERLTALTERVMRWKPVRVYTRFSERDGELLAAGMSFQSVFAVFAALFVGFAVAGFWLRANPDVLAAIIDIINGSVPGLIAEGGVISPDALASAEVIGWTGVVALVGLLGTAIGWLGFMRQAVRAVFGVPPVERFFLLQKGIDLLLALGFGLLLLAGGIVSVVSTAAVDWAIDLTGLDPDAVIASGGVRLVGIGVSVLINVAALSLIYRVLSAIPIPVRDLLVASTVGSVALAGLSIASGYLLGGATRNPLLATFAVFIGLLLWFAIVWRVVLLCATWIAVTLDERGVDVARYSPEQRRRREIDARRIVAEATLEEARTALEEAAGPLRRFRARRSLRRAEAEHEAATVAARRAAAP
jgi:membrane protein